jgi:hypothetical protein
MRARQRRADERQHVRAQQVERSGMTAAERLALGFQQPRQVGDARGLVRLFQIALRLVQRDDMVRRVVAGGVVNPIAQRLRQLRHRVTDRQFLQGVALRCV